MTAPRQRGVVSGMNVFDLLKLAYASTLLGSCFYVGRHGGRPEQLGIGIVAIGSLLTLAAAPFGAGWHASKLSLLALDLLILAAFVLIALRSGRFWPLWVTGFHLAAVATHVAMLVAPRQVLQAYAIAQGFWAYPMIGAIVFATARRRRLRASPRLHPTRF
ncbi:MAG: hypothetical protein JWM38_1337 [Sphingomonas bacterium]|nr:hypothetical protein [Sphingomonas bacterium]MDB5684131.1 hypothetical protein [Sphingomonas bacterium]MDB5717910.1 hypothetical protein [Sphingomonas bacterium]